MSLGLLKKSFNVAIREWEWCQDNPVNKIKMEKVPRGRVRYLTEGDFKKFTMPAQTGLNQY